MDKSDFYLIISMLFFIGSSVNDHYVPLMIVSGSYFVFYIIALIFEFINDKNKN